MQTLRPGRQPQLFLLQLFKHGASTGCMFSVLKATEKHVESRQQKKRPVFDKYAAAVASFVERYFAANQIYPKISEVVQNTGGNRSTIRRILNELNIEKNLARPEEVCVEGQDDMKEMHTIHSLDECMPSSIINGKNSTWPCSDKLGQLAEEGESAQVQASIDSMDAEMANERIDISAQNGEKKGFSVLRDAALLTLLDQAMHSSNKADANRRVAPLMEVLQQKSSGSSRRVHLSACGGIENDLSWEKTLQSIMPTSVGGKEDTSGPKDEQPKIDREDTGCQLKVEQLGHHLSSSDDECKESPGTASVFNFTIKVRSSKVKSVLNYTSGLEFRNALIQQAEVFKYLKNIKLLRRTGNLNAYALLQFKDYESMKKALKLKFIIIGGESLSLQKVRAGTDDTQLAERSVFQEVMQGMFGSLKKEDMSSKILHSPSYPCAEDKKSDVCMQAQHSSHPSFLQTISIQECPSNISLESIERFFCVFGKVQTSYGDFTHGKCRGIQIVVEFENESDKEKAMKVQQFTVDGCSFQLRSTSSLLVQLKYEGYEYLNSPPNFPRDVVTACKQYGVVQRSYLRNPQIVEITFRVNERHRIDELLTSLRGDVNFKEKWIISPVYEGYIKADFIPAWNKEKVKNTVVILNELSTYLSDLLANES